MIWLLPVHPISEKCRKGILGSLYVIRDYRAINPEYGTLDDFKRLVASIHQRSMKRIIDVVYNHTSPGLLADGAPPGVVLQQSGRQLRQSCERVV